MWDGEVPRFTSQAKVIQLSSEQCIFKVTMEESGFTRERTTEDPFSDQGPITVYLWSNLRVTTENTLQTLDKLFSETKNWSKIQLATGPSDNPYYVVDMELVKWYCLQLEGLRDRNANFIYEAALHYQVTVHGAIATR